jgi:hypothetical protein
MGWREVHQVWVIRKLLSGELSLKQTDWRPGSARWPVFDNTRCGKRIDDNDAAGVYLDDPEKL